MARSCTASCLCCCRQPLEHRQRLADESDRDPLPPVRQPDTHVVARTVRPTVPHKVLHDARLAERSETVVHSQCCVIMLWGAGGRVAGGGGEGGGYVSRVA